MSSNPKWLMVDILQKFFEDRFGNDGDTMLDEFIREFDKLVSEEAEQSKDGHIKIMHFIKAFKPALSLILPPGEDFNRVVRQVSPIFNAALSKDSQEEIQAEWKTQVQTRRYRSSSGQITPQYDAPENMTLTSVGIDIGSSTSHLVFSKLILKRERNFQNPSYRFMLVDREIIYESDIIFTPLIDQYTIDIDAVVKFCEDEYQKAGLTRNDVDTGAVVVTGETAKKQNAAEIVDRIASASGKFVSASAGPNYESVLGAMGSGIIDLSAETGKTIMNIDIGGGTSNIAICSEGKVFSTSCINAGGRLLGIDPEFKIWRIDQPTIFIMQQLGMKYGLGDTISEDDAKLIAETFAQALIEVMTGPAESAIAKELMMTDDCDFSVTIDSYSFSGGIAELIYDSDEEFDDIGRYLADAILHLVDEKGLSIIEPKIKIRATVIGAGAFTLSVSGSTCYSDKSIEFPITNIPVLPVNVNLDNYRAGIVEEEIHRALSKVDIEEGTDVVALYFKERLYHSYTWLQEFVKSIEHALPKTIENKKMIILLFGHDIGKMVGLMIRRETSIEHNLISLDELFLEEGDWIDIGAPIGDPPVFPVTVKSLIFNQSKEYS